MKPNRLVLILASCVAFAVVAAVASRSGLVTELMANPLVQQVEAEQRAFAVKANGDRDTLAAIIDDFTEGEPVRVVSVESDGAIVENSRGETMFATPDDSAVAAGELRWLAMGEEGPSIAGLAD